MHEVIAEIEPRKDETVEFKGEINGVLLDVISSPYSSENIASIEINRSEYAVNTRGFNIVLYNCKELKCDDSVAVDTHIPEYSLKRSIRGSLGREHYDVALLGCWWGANYGSLLNGYAVYSILKSLGLNVLLVNKHDAKPDDWELDHTHNSRFIAEHYPQEDITPLIPFDELYQLNYLCDCFITGSDQIWNYEINNYFKMAFLMNFVDDFKRKVSFGTSFGHTVDFTPAEKREYTRKLLQRFNAVSVREKSGKKICRSYGVKAEVVIEPVFCLSKTAYEKLSSKSIIEKPEKYILTSLISPLPDDTINEYIEKERKEALEWLKQALYTPVEKLPNIHVETFKPLANNSHP